MQLGRFGRRVVVLICLAMCAVILFPFSLFSQQFVVKFDDQMCIMNQSPQEVEILQDRN